MQTKRFVAADMRRALSMVRDELGEDAMILSTQRTSKGVEIIATAEDVAAPPKVEAAPVEMRPTEMAPPSYRSPHPSMVNAQQTAAERPSVGLASGKTQEELAQELEAARRKMLAVQQSQQENMTLTEWADRQFSKTRAQPSASQTNRAQTEVAQISEERVQQYRQRDEKEIQRLHEEITNMRSAFESQLIAMSMAQERQFQEQKNTQDIIPIAATVKQKLARLGLTQACNEQVIRSLRTVDDLSMDEKALWKESLARLARGIPAITNDPVATGGIYAFLGTTGVGKTTTIAKLAARYVMKHGADQVALLTTDTFRIGAHDQLRALGKILNVEVQVVDKLSELPRLLKRFTKQSLVLIDTPGMGYRDPQLNRHLSILRQCPHVQTSLVLSANSQYQMMQASLHSYRLANPRFCVMTKLDECASLGDAISLLSANDLALAYITDGQAIPDDISVIKAHQLVAKAVTLTQRPQIQGSEQRDLSSSKKPA